MKKLLYLLSLSIAISCSNHGYDKCCNCELPKPYYLAQDSVTKQYAIEWNEFGKNYFLYKWEGHYYGMGDPSEAYKFYDSCAAKKFAVETINAINSINANRFKSIKP